MSGKSLPVIQIKNDYEPDVIAKVLSDRGIPPAVYDFIAHNLGKGAALAAVLMGEYQKHEPTGSCGCS